MAAAHKLMCGSLAFLLRSNVNFEYDTSSDLASLGHLPLKGKAFGVVYYIVIEKSLEVRASCLPLQGKVARSAG